MIVGNVGVNMEVYRALHFVPLGTVGLELELGWPKPCLKRSSDHIVNVLTLSDTCF